MVTISCPSAKFIRDLLELIDHQDVATYVVAALRLDPQQA
jgi:hypothetical protein